MMAQPALGWGNWDYWQGCVGIYCEHGGAFIRSTHKLTTGVVSKFHSCSPTDCLGQVYNMVGPFL